MRDLAGILRLKEWVELLPDDYDPNQAIKTIRVGGSLMSWADNYIKKLQAGETVQFRPRGSSMSGRIESGQLVVVEPISSFYALEIDDIVLCRVAGHQYLHLVKSKDVTNKRVLICNNRGRENGWTGYNNVYGRVTAIKP